MVWGAIAGAAIGAVGSIYGDKKAGDAASDAAEMQAKIDQERLDWEKEQYEEWQETYGPIEDSLANYYESITPELRAVQGLEAFEKEKKVAMTNLRENLAQRGIQGSGIAAQMQADIARSSAEERARIRAAAPMEAAQEQSSFLQIGLGMNPAAGVSSALSDRSSTAATVASQAAMAAGQARGNAVTGVTNLASELANAFIPKPKPAATTGE